MRKILSILLLSIAVGLPLSAAGLGNASQYSVNRQETPKVTTGQGVMTVTACQDCALTFEVYSITGQIIKRFKLTDGVATIELHRGCYIVKCDKWSKKVVIN